MKASILSTITWLATDTVTSIAVIGAVEELAQSNRTISLVDEIFEINFFANVNIIKAILPVMRERKNGHIIVITGISKYIEISFCRFES